jgi:hypothetical protein
VELQTPGRDHRNVAMTLRHSAERVAKPRPLTTSSPPDGQLFDLVIAAATSEVETVSRITRQLAVFVG